jgi:hypothetical protein
LALDFTALPNQRNLLNFCSKSCITFLGNIKTRAQNICRLTKTEDRSCNLPAKDSFLTSQESILDYILEIRLSQSAVESLLEMRRTPKYLIGRTLSSICSNSKRFCLAAGVTPARKTELLEGLASKPERASNLARAPMQHRTEAKVATKKN